MVYFNDKVLQINSKQGVKESFKPDFNPVAAFIRIAMKIIHKCMVLLFIGMLFQFCFCTIRNSC